MIARMPPGHTADNIQPGDIGLVADHKPTIIHELIQARERVDFGRTAWANLTHSFAIIDADGTILEALSEGIKRANISKYRDADYYVISPQAATYERRDLCVKRWLRHENDPYDKLNYVGQTLVALFGWRVSIAAFKHFICSGYCCYGALAYEVDFPIAFESMTPAHVAAYYGLTMPEPPNPLSLAGRALNLLTTLGHIIARPFAGGGNP